MGNISGRIYNAQIVNGEIVKDELGGYLVTGVYLAETCVTASYALKGPGVSTVWNDIDGKPEGIVSASEQVDYDLIQNQPTLIDSASYALSASYAENSGVSSYNDLTDVPADIVSGSTQIDYNSIQNQPTSILSASYAQNADLATTASYAMNGGGETIPVGTVSSSVQVDHDQTTNYDANKHFLQSAITEVGTVVTGDISDILPSGLLSGSVSYTDLTSVPTGIVSSSNQVSYNGITDVPTGIVSESSQVDYDLIQNQPTLIDSASYATTASHALNASTPSWDEVTSKPTVVSSSIQVDHDATTNYNSNQHFLQSSITQVGTVTSGNVDAILPSDLVSGSLIASASHAEYATQALSASYAINAESVPAGTVSSSVQIDHDATTNFVANEHIDWTQDQGGAQINPANYSATASVATSSYSFYAVTASSVSYFDVTDKPDLPTGLVSSSAQIDYDLIQNQPTLIESASYALTASYAENAGGVTSYDDLTDIPVGIVSGSLIDSASYAINPYALVGTTYSATMSFDNGADNIYTASLTGDAEIELTNPTLGNDTVVTIYYTGDQSVTYDTSTIELVGGIASTGSGEVDRFLFTCVDSTTPGYVLSILNNNPFTIASASYATVAENILGTVSSASYSLTTTSASYASYAPPQTYAPVSSSYATTMSVDNSAYEMTYATASANFHVAFTNPTLLKDSMVEVRYTAANVTASFDTGISVVGGTQQSGSGEVDYLLGTCTNVGGEYILSILNRN